MMEHNSNYVPWYAMCREILPRLGRRVEYRLARFDPGTGELDLAHLASLIDVRTKLVCCTGASNFLGTLPFLYGGDMIAEGRVFPWQVEYNSLPWKYAAGTPNILGAIVSAQALRIVADLALTPDRLEYFGTARPLRRAAIHAAMNRICAWNRQLTSRALDGLGGIGGITIYGPRDPARRTSLVAFNLAGRDPVAVAEALDQAGVEARAGCHCATLAHHALGLSPPASCRLSFYLYNTPDDIDQAVAAVAAIAAGGPATCAAQPAPEPPRSPAKLPRRPPPRRRRG